ncbi:hypothetical protein [Sulfuracidifex tepidarius]|uniref:Uncharacterized protein n=1 Tax=Sulfuracidifex tepidarius TaxID=1294262 RepID=A0A510E0G7_9CREN|nr:hypothetical protein [Sulfuracidifex tepidarius]BBG25598.1 hypothetical protein IC007_0103 [Sulfuracidifex tepidarius]
MKQRIEKAKLSILIFSLFLAFSVVNPQTSASSTQIQVGSFTVYKSVDHIYYPYRENITDIYINVVQQFFKNGSILVNSTNIDCTSTPHIALRVFTLGNHSSCLGLRYISPDLLGENVSGLTFQGIKDGYYVYASSSSVEDVNVIGLYYFMSDGVAYKITFNQTSGGSLVSYTCFVLVTTNIGNSSATIPHYSYELKKPTSLNLLNDITPLEDKIEEYIVGSGLIMIIIIFIFRRK